MLKFLWDTCACSYWMFRNCIWKGNGVNRNTTQRLLGFSSISTLRSFQGHEIAFIILGVCSIFYACFNVRLRSQGWTRSKHRLKRGSWDSVSISVRREDRISWIMNLHRTTTYRHAQPYIPSNCLFLLAYRSPSGTCLTCRGLRLQFPLPPQSGGWWVVYTFQGPRISAPITRA
jgi:hypothetical protein